MSVARAVVGLEAHFIDGPLDKIFQLRILPEQPSKARGRVLIVSPFAEEMNRSRRFLVELARALARHGFAVSLPDLHGTGDSGGEFGAATWERWLRELAFLRGREAEREAAPLFLLGVRTGALLAAESVANDGEGIGGLVTIQAVQNGESFLNRLLRVRVAARMAQGERETTKDLRARLAAGKPVEVAGYALSPALARELAERRAARLALPRGLPIWWYDVVSPATETPPAPAPPASWDAGRLIVRQLRAEAFWNLPEPTVPDALIAAVCQDLEQAP